MKKVKSLDDFRHKLVDKILHSRSYEEVKRYLLAAIYSLEKHKIHGHLVGRFIDKTLDQLHGMSLFDMEVKFLVNVQYAKLQLEIIKRHRVERKEGHVQA